MKGKNKIIKQNIHTKHVKTVSRLLTHGYEWVYQTAAMTKM